MTSAGARDLSWDFMKVIDCEEKGAKRDFSLFLALLVGMFAAFWKLSDRRPSLGWEMLPIFLRRAADDDGEFIIVEKRKTLAWNTFHRQLSRWRHNDNTRCACEEQKAPTSDGEAETMSSSPRIIKFLVRGEKLELDEKSSPFRRRQRQSFHSSGTSSSFNDFCSLITGESFGFPSTFLLRFLWTRGFALRERFMRARWEMAKGGDSCKSRICSFLSIPLSYLHCCTKEFSENEIDSQTGLFDRRSWCTFVAIKARFLAQTFSQHLQQEDSSWSAM